MVAPRNPRPAPPDLASPSVRRVGWGRPCCSTPRLRSKGYVEGLARLLLQIDLHALVSPKASQRRTPLRRWTMRTSASVLGGAILMLLLTTLPNEVLSQPASDSVAVFDLSVDGIQVDCAPDGGCLVSVELAVFTTALMPSMIPLSSHLWVDDVPIDARLDELFRVDFPLSCEHSTDPLCEGGDCEPDSAYCGKFTAAVAVCLFLEEHCGCRFGFYLTGWFEIPTFEILETSLVRVCIDNLDGSSEFDEGNNCREIEVALEPTASGGTTWTSLKTFYR